MSRQAAAGDGRLPDRQEVEAIIDVLSVANRIFALNMSAHPQCQAHQGPH
jgi:hypothetical protein